MARKFWRSPFVISCALLVSTLMLSSSNPGLAGSMPQPQYGAETDQLLWFIQTSDTHIGASGSTDANRLRWLVTDALTYINPSFIIVTGDLTDSTNGDWLGIPDGPHQEEWTEYKTILSGVSPEIYYDVPGNHDAYSDGDFSYYLANSVHGRATGGTQASIIRQVDNLSGTSEYLFLGLNTAGNNGAAFSLFAPYGDYAGLDDGELNFVADEMAAHSNAKLTFVFGHHPLFDTGEDTYVYYGLDRFMSLMKGAYSTVYGYGHTHGFSEDFFVPNDPLYKGFFYFNVASLGKSSSNQYTIMAIDHDGFSSKTRNVGAWPAVLITAPLDVKLGVNPYTYAVPISASNPIRALVFDRNAVSAVQYRIDSGSTWYPMSVVPENPRLWQATWNASSITQGPHTIEVQANSGSGTSNDVITVNVVGAAPTLKVGAEFGAIGKYVTSRKTGTVFDTTSPLYPGDRIVFRVSVKDTNTPPAPVSGATVQLNIAGPLSTTATTSAATNSQGVAELSWQTAAPGKRNAGTPTGLYTATVTKVTTTSLPWNGTTVSRNFSITARTASTSK